MAAAAATLLVSACTGSGERTVRSPHPTVIGPGRTVIPVAQRHQLPQLAGRTLAGQQLSLADVIGAGVVVVNVWASWCVECRAESAGLAALERELSGRGVRFVGIDEQDRPERARHFVASVRARYPSLVDPRGQLLGRLTLLPDNGIPSTLIVDREGRMAARVVGVARRAVLARLIDRVSAGR